MKEEILGPLWAQMYTFRGEYCDYQEGIAEDSGYME